MGGSVGEKVPEKSKKGLVKKRTEPQASPVRLF